MSEQANTSDIVDFIWVPGNEFVDEFRVEWETFRNAELIFSEQQKLRIKQMPEQTETRRKVGLWKNVIIGIGRIRFQRRRKPNMQLHINENNLNLNLPTV